MRGIIAKLRRSLTARLLVGLILPTAGLAALLGVGGMWMIDGIVESVNDRLIEASARAIADTVALEDGEVTLDLPSSAFGMLENDERDNVYYSVRQGRELVTGYPDLPAIANAVGETALAYSSYRGNAIRVVSIGRNVPRVREPVFIQVAETLEARNGLRNRMQQALILLEVTLIAILVLLLPLAVRWGLSPLSRVRRQIDQRKPTDFTPLELEEVPREMRSFLIAFNGLLSRLQDAVEGMRRFTADASHQMRTPLSVLRAHLEVVRREGVRSEHGRESLADVEAAAARLQRLLTQLLALARAESAKDAAASMIEPVEIVGVVRQVAESYIPAALKVGVELQFETNRPIVVVASIEVLAHELLANLVDNAIRYNQRQGVVCIAINDCEDGVLVSVEDDGPGIPAEARATMFKRFSRLARDEKWEGSGLGLAIVEALAAPIGATVSISDRGTLPGLRIEIRFRKFDAATGA